MLEENLNSSKRKQYTVINDINENKNDTDLISNYKKQKQREYSRNYYSKNKISILKNKQSKRSMLSLEDIEKQNAKRLVINLSYEKIDNKRNTNNKSYKKNNKATKTAVNSSESLSLQWDYKNFCEL